MLCYRLCEMRAPASLCLQGPNTHLWQPVPLPHHPHCNKLLSYFQPKSPLLQFEIISLALSQQTPLKSLSPPFRY